MSLKVHKPKDYEAKVFEKPFHTRALYEELSEMDFGNVFWELKD